MYDSVFLRCKWSPALQFEGKGVTIIGNTVSKAMSSHMNPLCFQVSAFDNSDPFWVLSYVLSLVPDFFFRTGRTLCMKQTIAFPFSCQALALRRWVRYLFEKLVLAACYSSRITKWFEFGTSFELFKLIMNLQWSLRNPTHLMWPSRCVLFAMSRKLSPVNEPLSDCAQLQSIIVRNATSNIDLYPTMLKWAGIDIEKGDLDGRDLTPFFSQGKHLSVDTIWDSHVKMSQNLSQELHHSECVCNIHVFF